ncbi:MAG: FHA domain-containing protein, partial [Alphaproteobacteria bacterium]|nr:FHA domain-containing protein [Alphaproteobacteria bacterium]
MKLVIHHGTNAGTSYRLSEGRNVAGRAPDCELVLPSKRVSRHHCAFHVRGDICVVEDL